MDITENVSPRVLLRHILVTELPRTPITRSATKRRSSSRMTPSKKDAGAPTPQNILRRSLKNKIRESITRKSLSATARRRTNPPALTSMLFDDGVTPRHILKNILLTEPVKSPVVHVTASEEPHQPSASSSDTKKRPRTELSGLDLPDLTIGSVASSRKGLRRKRPRRSLNATDFEKRLGDGEDVEAEHEESRVEQSSLSSLNSTSLSLKTPFVDVHTEKRGLKRRVPNRRKITMEGFDAAVINRQIGESSIKPAQRMFTETSYTDGFTLGLSELSEPDITDIVNCNTALYAHTDGVASNSGIVASQHKPMASHLQSPVMEMKEDTSKVAKEKSMHAFPTKEVVVTEDENQEWHLVIDDDTAKPQKKVRERTTDIQSKDTAAMSESEERVRHSQTSGIQDMSNEVEDVLKAQSEESPQTEEDPVTTSDSKEEEAVSDSSIREDAVESLTEEEATPDSQTEDDDGAKSQTEEDNVAVTQSDSEEVEATPDSQTEDDDAAESQTEEDNVAVTQSDSEEVEATPDSQTEDDDAAESQTEEDNVAVTQSDSEEVEATPDSQTEDDDAAESQTGECDAVDFRKGVETTSQLEGEEDVVDCHTEEEHDGKQRQEEEDGEHCSGPLELGLEHISRKTYCSEGSRIIASSGGELADATDMGWSDKSKAHSAVDPRYLEMRNQDKSRPQTETVDLAESSTQEQKHTTFTVAGSESDQETVSKQEVMHDNNDRSDASPVGADEQEEEWEDEEREEVPCKTPAFISVREPKTPLKNIQASGTSEELTAAKPKQARQRRRGPAKKEAGLPKSYLMGTFKHFAKTKVSADVYPVLKEIMDKFFDRLAEDLETYAHHAKRNTIEYEDALLLLRRQGYVNDKVPVEVLIEKYLRMDQRRLLIPIATSGNVVIPKKR